MLQFHNQTSVIAKQCFGQSTQPNCFNPWHHLVWLTIGLKHIKCTSNHILSWSFFSIVLKLHNLINVWHSLLFLQWSLWWWRWRRLVSPDGSLESPLSDSITVSLSSKTIPFDTVVSPDAPEVDSAPRVSAGCLVLLGWSRSLLGELAFPAFDGMGSFSCSEERERVKKSYEPLIISLHIVCYVSGCTEKLLG